MTQFDVIQAHIGNGLQGPQHITLLGKHLRGLSHRQIQNIRNIQTDITGLRIGMAVVESHLKYLGTITLSIAIRAAQINIAEELHLDVLKSRAPTQRAPPITTVKAEFRGCVPTLTGQRCRRKQAAQRIPSADIAHRVRARGFTDGRLVNKDHITQLLRTQQTAMRTRCLRGLTEVPHQGRRQYVLDERGFARPAHARHTDQSLQREIDVDVLQVVGGYLFKNQARRVLTDHPLESHTHLFAVA